MLAVDITAQNNGTAPAYNVQTHLLILNQQYDGPVVAALGPGRFDTVRFDKTIGSIMKGRYPLIVRVDFHDANQYPFSALSVTTFDYQYDVNTDLTIVNRDITLEKDGILSYDIKRSGIESRHIRARLILPKEFSVKTPETDFNMDAGSGKNIYFEIRNLFALAGAQYPVFCAFEFDLNGVHHTQIARTLVNIAKEENLFRRFRWLWIALTVVLTISFVVVIVKSK